MRLTNENIDDLIDAWHESDGSQALHEFLGLTWEEFKYWVENKSLPEKKLFRSKDLRVH
jgi:hypothetical protein